MVKRVGNLWKDVVSMDNIRLAYANARRGKSNRKEVREIDKDPEPYLQEIQKRLIDGTFHSSEYRLFTIHESKKERIVADLPFFPDRIVHWALIQVVEPILTSNLISQTFAALPRRGTHSALSLLKKYLKNDDAKFCLKMDVKKFFPSIDKDILIKKLQRRIKDSNVIDLFARIIYEYPESGTPIGNYTSQYLANFYLSDIDHFMKERFHCKYYLRYMDDIVILGWDKKWLHRAERKMEGLLATDRLQMKRIWQVFPIKSRGVDFVGYRSFKGYTLLRSDTKKRLKRATKRLMCVLQYRKLDIHDIGRLSSYRGVLSWCDGYRLGKITVFKIDKELTKWI